MYIRFKIAQLLRQKEERERRVITWREVDEHTGISPSVLSNLASPARRVVTTTRYVAALMEYFKTEVSSPEGVPDFNKLLALEDDDEASR